MLATIVDTGDLLQTVLASLVAGIGITAVFSVMIFGMSRFADRRRDDQPVAAAAFGALGVVAFAIFAAAVVFGLIVMTTK